MLTVTESKLKVRSLLIKHQAFQYEMSSNTVYPTVIKCEERQDGCNTKYISICVMMRSVDQYLFVKKFDRAEIPDQFILLVHNS